MYFSLKISKSILKYRPQYKGKIFFVSLKEQTKQKDCVDGQCFQFSVVIASASNYALH